MRLHRRHPGVSRLRSGLFPQAIDVEYAGSLEHGIAFDGEQVLKALKQIRKMNSRHRALSAD